MRAPSGEREARAAAAPGGPPNPVAPGPGPVVTLHVPDEPAGRKDGWRRAVLEGAPLAEVVGGHDGVADWLWARWSALGRVGVGRERFVELTTAYRREVWLWLGGDRTWTQCCAGLIGRVGRRAVLR